MASRFDKFLAAVENLGLGVVYYYGDNEEEIVEVFKFKLSKKTILQLIDAIDLSEGSTDKLPNLVLRRIVDRYIIIDNTRWLDQGINSKLSEFRSSLVETLLSHFKISEDYVPLKVVIREYIALRSKLKALHDKLLLGYKDGIFVVLNSFDNFTPEQCYALSDATMDSMVEICEMDRRKE